MFDNVPINQSGNCEKCSRLMVIQRSYIQYENDDCEDKETHAHQIAIVSCANPKCSEFGINRFGGSVCLDSKKAVHTFCSNCGKLLCTENCGEVEYGQGVTNGEENTVVCDCGYATSINLV